jgi:NTE family protein
VDGPHQQRPVALVLAGGGARGAYEAGALSVLLPVLEEHGERPTILVGTSAGALNVTFLAANAQLPAPELMGSALGVWESVRWGEVARQLLSPASLRRAATYAGEVLGVPGSRLESLLDPDPLRATLSQQVDFEQLATNVKAGRLAAAAVVATSAHTGRSVVFHSGGASPPQDRRRRIDYVSTELTEDHALASAAIPTIFPAVNVRRPRKAQGWYFDGGTRLNTPVKPALALGAERVVVIAVDSLAAGPAKLAGDHRPDALEGAGQVLLGLLDDQLRSDLQTMATINEMVSSAPDAAALGKRLVPYIVIAPAKRDAIAVRALDVVRRHYSGALEAISSPNVALLARLLAGGADRQHAALLSFLLFAPEFTRALVELGRQDANRWVEATHERDDLWETGPNPA